MRLVLVLLLLLVPTMARAQDTVTKTDGAKLRGTVLLDTPEGVKIKTAGGVIMIPREEVAKVERQKDVWHELDERRVALEKDQTATAAQWLALARWCQERELWVPSIDCFHEVVKRNPDDADARFELGYRKVDGKWIPESEYFSAKGYVQHEGRWVTPQEKEKLDQGLVKVGNEWLPPAEAEKREPGGSGAEPPNRPGGPAKKDAPAKGPISPFVVKHAAPPPDKAISADERKAALEAAQKAGGWACAHSSKHYDFLSNGPLDEVKKLAATMDQMCDEYRRIFAYKPEITRPFPVWLYGGQQEFMQHTGHGPGVGGFYDGERIVGFHGRLGSLTTETVLFHEGTHQFQGLVFGQNMWRAKIWFIEGLAVFFESSSVDKKGLQQQIPRERLLQVKRAIQANQYVHLADLIRMEQREFGALHYAHAWSLIYFLCNGTKGGLERFKKYFEGVKDGKEGVKLFEELFDRPIDQVEAAWKAYILAM